MTTWIPDSIWRLLPDSMGGFISAAWLVLVWILRLVALRWTENGSGSSPYRGMLCSAAAVCGSVALGAAGLVLVALYTIKSFGLLLAIVAVPVFLLAVTCGYMFYRGAQGEYTSRAEPNPLIPTGHGASAVRRTAPNVEPGP